MQFPKEPRKWQLSLTLPDLEVVHDESTSLPLQSYTPLLSINAKVRRANKKGRGIDEIFPFSPLAVKCGFFLCQHDTVEVGTGRPHSRTFGVSDIPTLGQERFDGVADFESCWLSHSGYYQVPNLHPLRAGTQGVGLANQSSGHMGVEHHESTIPPSKTIARWYDFSTKSFHR